MDFTHRDVAVATYNRCWELLEREERSAADDLDLLTAAFTSRFHWLEAGGPEQWATSDWMVARAAGAIGVTDLAVTFARRADEAATAEFPDWLLASLAEGLARALALAGDPERDAAFLRAEALVAAIADDEDRAVIAGQLASVPR